MTVDEYNSFQAFLSKKAYDIPSVNGQKIQSTNYERGWHDAFKSMKSWVSANLKPRKEKNDV